MKRVSRACLLVAFFVMSSCSWAQTPDWRCFNYAYPGGGDVRYDPVVLTIPGFDTGAFKPNVRDGTVLVSKEVTMTSSTGRRFISCPGSNPNQQGNIGMTAWIGTGADGGGRLYATGVPGVWFRFRFSDKDIAFPKAMEVLGPTTDIYEQTKLLIELIKKGEITTAGVITGEVAGWFRWPGVKGQQLVSIRIGGTITVEPQVPTCRVTTPTITVPLGNMPASTFTGVGASSPGKPFNIALQCSNIDAGKSLNVYTTLTDHTNPGNVSDTLSLASDATATGIGIQVLNGSTVVKYGPDSSAIGNTNQWKAGEAGNGTFTIPLTARYVQTAPKVTPGSANGLATFTMSYQ